jgi:predicted RNA binding protein YcfA (HicA-like mRNA interferase family)
MTRLPRNVSGRECVRALERAGYKVRRQTGSHIILTREEPPTLLTVPDHRNIKPGTLRSIIRQAELTVEEFVDLL